MGNGKYASAFDMSELWDGLQRSDRDDKEASSLAKFCHRIGGDKDSATMFSGLQDLLHPKSAKWNSKLFI